MTKTPPMIEVFSTNVRDHGQAGLLISRIHQAFTGYKANFDLEDCDLILRVESPELPIDNAGLIRLLKTCGFQAEVLPDIVPPCPLKMTASD